MPTLEFNTWYILQNFTGLNVDAAYIQRRGTATDGTGRLRNGALPTFCRFFTCGLLCAIGEELNAQTVGADRGDVGLFSNQR